MLLHQNICIHKHCSFVIISAKKLVLYLIITAAISTLQINAWKRRPHICFILADDLGWNDVSFHGSLQIPTPNIDLLAANGIVLNNYYTQPLCTPSRAALLSARHPIHLGLQHYALMAAQPGGLSLNVTLLPQYLKRLGYATHAVGKWHLGFYKKEYTPTYRGFDSFLGFWPGKMDYYDHTTYEIYRNSNLLYGWGKSLRRNMEPEDWLTSQYATNIFTNRAIEVIKSHKPSKPLFLYVSHLAVHSANPYNLFQVPSKYNEALSHINNTARRKYGGMVLTLDESIGKIFKTLDQKRMLKNLIFIVSTDNGGEAAGFRGGVASNWPLRGTKLTPWEGGIRATALIWSRLLKSKTRINNQLMHISDWLPTLYHAAGGNSKDLGNIYGQDLWESLFFDLPSPRNELLHNIDPIDKVFSLRMGDYKLIKGSHLGIAYDGWYGPTGRDNGISYSEYTKQLYQSDVSRILEKHHWLTKITKRWLAQLEIHCLPKNLADIFSCRPTIATCLFNIFNDPCEQNNIADKYPEIVNIMEKYLKDYHATSMPLVNQIIDPKADPYLHNNRWTNWGDTLDLF